MLLHNFLYILSHHSKCSAVFVATEDEIQMAVF